MPRFGSTSPIFSPPSGREAPPAMVSQQTRKRDDNSVSLSCLSPDGRVVHSLALQSNGAFFIESHSLPLRGTSEQEVERDLPAVVETRLSDGMQSSLALDSAIELFCVDGDSSSTKPRQTPIEDDNDDNRQFFVPLLCLYTRKSAFLLQMSYTYGSQNDNSVPERVQGKVLSVIEPFESSLIGGTTSIVRIRSAPQRRAGYATICPPASMAMLTDEYALVLYHGPQSKTAAEEGIVTMPLTFGVEELDAYDEENRIVDFCFAQSNEMSLLASMAVLLLKGSGDVMGASPILFDGAVVPRSALKESLDYIEGEIQRLNDDSTIPKWRQYKAAEMFVLDAFANADSSGSSHFVTACLRSSASVRSPTLWPVQLQGPAVVAPVVDPDEQSHSAFAVEPFFAKDLIGMAIGKMGQEIDFCILPATALLPRFVYEGDEDRAELDYSLCNMGAVVERVAVDSTKENAPTGRSALVLDPVVDTMLHYISSRGILSVKTNIMTITSNTILKQLGDTDGRNNLGCMSPSGSKRSKEQVQTTAWTCLEVASAGGGSLAGAVVSNDAHIGHVLVARMSNGSMDAVNMTESRYLHEVNSVFEAKAQELQQKSTEAAVVDEALNAMEELPALHTLVKPLVQQVTEGISGMGKIIGGATAPKKITPNLLAVAEATKIRCDKEITLPLNQIKKLTVARMEVLKVMHKNQLAQIETLKELIRGLKEQSKEAHQQLKIAESNSTELSQQSSATLQACQDLLPTITEAEFDYFEDVKRHRDRCTTYEQTIKKLQDSSTSICDSMQPGSVVCSVHLDPPKANNLATMLNVTENFLENSKNRLDETGTLVKELAAATGVCGIEESPAEVQLYNQ